MFIFGKSCQNHVVGIYLEIHVKTYTKLGVKYVSEIVFIQKNIYLEAVNEGDFLRQSIDYSATKSNWIAGWVETNLQVVDNLAGHW